MKKHRKSASSRNAGPPTSPADQSKPAATRPIAALIAAFVLMFFFLCIPREVVTADLDASWGAVLDYAHGKRLQFGTDIVFTYGPLGYLAIQWFTGHAPVLRMLFDIVFDFGIAAGVCLLAWRTAIYWRIFLLGAFVLLPATISPGMFDVPMEIGLFSWAVLCLVESRPRVRLYAVVFCTIAVIGSMVKFTFFLMDSITVAMLAMDLVLRREFRLACGVAVGYLAGALCLWALLGQNLLHIGDYVKTSLEISAGYQSAMGFQFENYVWTAGVFTAFLALAVGLIRILAADEPVTGRTWLRRGLFSVWLFSMLFLAWKHGFVRTKSDLWAGFVAFAALSLEALPVPEARRTPVWTARVCGIVCCVLALLVVYWGDHDHFSNLAGRESARFSDNVRAVLNPAGYVREMNSRLDAERARLQLPRLRQAIGGGTVDVFGQSQAVATLNELNYRPRPVFQSYSAYNPALMELNDRAFASNTPPDFVIFNLEPIDGRFPSLEDAPLLRRLLADYTLVGSEGPFLLLKHQSSTTPQMTLLREGTVHVLQPIHLEEYHDLDLWLEISLTPTARGRLREMLYKPPQVRLAVVDQTSTTRAKVYRAPVPMLAAGFLASPILAQSSDVANLYTGNTILRPRGYVIVLQTNTADSWQDLIQYRVYRVDTRLGRNSTFDPAQLEH